MKPPSFEYHAPSTVEEALALLAAPGRRAKVLAGGQSLVPMMNARTVRPDVLVDIAGIADLRFIRVSTDGALEVGAGARQSELLRTDSAKAGWPVLIEAVRHIGYPQLRSRGTICGSLAYHHPTAELPAVAIALDARLTVTGSSGPRTVLARDFFVAPYRVALAADDLVTEVAFPRLPPRTGWSFREISLRRRDFPLVGAVALLADDGGGGIATARITVFGVAERPLRLHDLEQTVIGLVPDESTSRLVAQAAARAIDTADAPPASTAYHRGAAAELAADCFDEAWSRRDHV